MAKYTTMDGVWGQLRPKYCGEIHHNGRRLGATRGEILRRNSPKNTLFEPHIWRRPSNPLSGSIFVAEFTTIDGVWGKLRAKYRGGIHHNGWRLGTTRSEMFWWNSPKNALFEPYI